MANKKLLIICPYPLNVAPSQRLKFEQYYPYFRSEGYEIEISSFISIKFWKIIYKEGFFFQKLFYTVKGYFKRINDLFRLRKFDVVYIHLWVTPFGWPLFERLFRLSGKKIVYDVDDLVYLKGVKSKAHSVVNLLKGRKKPIYLMKKSDHVITCTPYLDEFVRQFNPHTTDISSTIDTTIYQPVNDYSNNKKLTIGWSGSISTAKYFYLLSDILKKVREKYDFRILVVGEKHVQIQGLDVEAVDWEEEKELFYLQQMDIGVYPLPFEEWVYGKSGLKAIQYMALAIPTVATAIGANYRVIEDGVSGYLVKEEAQWIETLENLLSDALLRKKIGIAGRKRVKELFSIEANKTIYLNILNRLSNKIN